MKAGDLVKAHNKAQTIGVVMCVEASRIQVLAEGEMCWWWEHNATIISEVVSENR
jgi:hypothetical protein|tara:strand:+ start:43 stop:207 length:165 start_codon:yes stop_codon:yes gene_type:complete